jgi:hypothetical protein
MNVSSHLFKLGLTGNDALKINALLSYFREHRSIYDRLSLRIWRSDASFDEGMVHEAALRGDVRVAYQMLEMPHRFSEALRMSAARQGVLPMGIRKIFGLIVSDRLFRFIEEDTGFDMRDRLYFRYSGECVDPLLMDQSRFDISLQLDEEPFVALRIALSEPSLIRLFGLMGGDVESLGDGPTDLPLIDVAMRLCTIDIPIKGAASLEPGDMIMVGRFNQGFEHLMINGSAFGLLVDDDGDARLDVER